MKDNTKINDPPMTIDLLILSTLGDGKIHSARSIAATWGEDYHRVLEWLYRFKKQGLARTTTRRNDGWIGYASKIFKHIEEKKSSYL